MRVNYAIVFVSDMERSVSFYRDVIGLPLKFESPEWTEFATDGATLALHAAEASGSETVDPDHVPAGRCRPGLLPVRLADTDVCSESDVPGNIFDGFNVAGRWPTGGDYFGLASDSTGDFHILWADSRTGVFQLWATRATVK